MSVAFKELAGSPTETYGSSGLKAVRRVLCAWEDYRTLINEILANAYLTGNFTLSAPYPGYPQVVAAQVKVEPFQANPNDGSSFTDITADLNSYNGQFALLTITYELLVLEYRLPNVQSGTYLTYRMDFSQQTLALPGYSWTWEDQPDAPVPPESSPIVRVPVIEHHLSWHRVDNPPWTAIRNCVGGVNGSDFLGATAETVLFEGATAAEEFVSLGDRNAPQYSWKLDYVFKERAIKYSYGSAGTPTICGWNHSYRALPSDSPGFDRLLDTNGNPLYPDVDFSALFLFEPST
jgi:hypothetical protein